ncbi:hypothetical protein DSO57_1012519 [Entomophthora muscae]|uniref:Uncharacterized protein n=1 Tax=Entomophthora muscae TaxID=34485 RepID=A0ACC2U4D9_9FUNG|nr:hypothetical protein DSO57_1012519 [Entomophthora muscae]
MDQGAAYLHFLETEPLQAEAPAKSQSQNTSASWAMVVPKEELLELPNGSRESSSVTNKIQSPKEKMGFRPNLMTTDQNQENKVINLDVSTNERTPTQGAILLLLHPGLLATCPHFPQYFEETLMKNTNVKTAGSTHQPSSNQEEL